MARAREERLRRVRCEVWRRVGGREAWERVRRWASWSGGDAGLVGVVRMVEKE